MDRLCVVIDVGYAAVEVFLIAVYIEGSSATEFAKPLVLQPDTDIFLKWEQRR